jgi:hypothetical protein
MSYALALAHGLAEGRTLMLPNRLDDVERRAEFIHGTDDLLMIGSTPEQQLASLGRRLRSLDDATAEVAAGIEPLDRIAIALRLWAGCLSAAKTIAFETRSGANTPEERARLFEGIDQVAGGDELFRAGVEAAPLFKRIRGQPFSLEGVPANSPVRRYADGSNPPAR